MALGLKYYCCGFDFEKFYGQAAKGSAIVHHLHLKNPPMGVDELKEIISVLASVVTEWCKTQELSLLQLLKEKIPCKVLPTSGKLRLVNSLS